MGKDWWYWGVGGGGGGGGGRSTKSGRSGGVPRDTPSGCMSAVFQLFDFHQSQFAFHQQVPSFKPDSFLPEEPTILKGVEAPRNSLEVDEAFMEPAPFPSTMEEEFETLNIPMGIQIKKTGATARSKVGAPKARPDDLSSECSSSPGAKTPNLVARLMGLDLLPDSCSHSSSNRPSKSHPNPQLQYLKQEFQSRQVVQSRSSSGRSLFDSDIAGTRSLPETPRISAARRSDVDHHRLSLQINKENVGVSAESEFSGYSTLKTARRRGERQEDESPSPGHYARQIVKQVRERVSRKVGLDITNTVRNRDDHVVLLKAKKPSKGLARVGYESSPSKESTPSCSPRLRFLELKNKPVTAPAPKNQLVHSPKLPSPLSSSVNIHPQKSPATLQEQKQNQQNQNQKCKRIASERYSPRLKKPPQTSDLIRNRQEEPFVRSSAANRANLSDKKSKKTPLSGELLNINVPTLFPVKKDPSSPTTKLPQKQSQVSDTVSSKRSAQLSSCSSQTYKQEATHTLTVQDSSCYGDSPNGATTGGGAEYQYITGILKRTGIDINTPLSFTKWYSPSHPLDPSIFHNLELFSSSTTTATAANYSQLSHRCNRKLIFHLVDEILAEILKPYINLKPWVSPITHNHQMSGSQLIETLCSRIQSFPLADCRMLEDIDALIDRDLLRSQLGRSMAFEEEGEAIVGEIERDLVDTLVHETALFWGWPVGS